MKAMKKAIAALLVIILTITSIPFNSSAALSDASAADYKKYTEDILKRYNDYLASDLPQPSIVINDNVFMHHLWMEELKSQSSVNHAITWATQKLTGHDADQNTYTNYLTKVLAIHEKGYLETLDAQAKMNEEIDYIGDINNVAGMTLDVFLEIVIPENISDALKALKSGIDLASYSNKTISSINEAYAYSTYCKAYVNKIYMLQAIYDNTDNEKLKKSCSLLMDTTHLNFLYAIEEMTDPDFIQIINNVADVAKFTSNVATTLKLFDGLGKKMSGFGAWLVSKSKLAASVGSWYSSKGAEILGAANMYLDGFSSILLGFQIGGFVGNIFWGSDLERFCEIEIMDAISTSLSKALNTAMDELPGYPVEKVEEPLKKIVCIGEGLAISRLRGENCFIESRRNNFIFHKVTEDEENRYADNENNCMYLYTEFNKIFPDNEQQVIVTASVDEDSESNWGKDIFTSSISKPVVYLPGNEPIAKKINESAALSDSYDKMYEERENTKKWANSDKKYITYAYSYDVKIQDVFSVPGALSIQLMEVSYTGGAHPISGRASFNFNLETGEPITFWELFDDTMPIDKTKIITMFVNHYDPKLSYSDIPVDSITNALNDSSSTAIWRFTRNGLTITFSPYMVAAYSAGYIEVTVSYDELKDLINDKYIPNDYSKSVTDGYASIIKTKEAKKYANTYGVNEKKGTAILFNGKTYDVRLGTAYSSSYSPFTASNPNFYDVRAYANFTLINDVYLLQENKSENNSDYGLYYQVLDKGDNNYVINPVTLDIKAMK